ncbi:MAG TPA: DnaJ domain-containing protein [Gemmatimonadales bacterium]|jgi:curved DNA-binding protein CbpA|nr:DnaJ domain-containing protein [Gemmatimonadales bacterium]
MADTSAPDHYEVLQLSPRADQTTIQRVFRHLAKRYHPDNQESGDAERFKQVMDAFEVLSDPARRAKYDARYQDLREAHWRIFDQESAGNDVVADRRLRDALLSILYTARRNDAERPGLGVIELERLLGCPEQHMRFHLWYLKQNGWIERTESGTYAVTASGVDQVLDRGGPMQPGKLLLEPGERKRARGAAHG